MDWQHNQRLIVIVISTVIENNNAYLVPFSQNDIQSRGRSVCSVVRYLTGGLAPDAAGTSAQSTSEQICVGGLHCGDIGENFFCCCDAK